MIRNLKKQEIRPLNRISPSQYYSAVNCPFKLVLANSFGYESLLPMNANAHFGSVAHKMIELISKGVVIDEQTFSENWTALIIKKEDELKSKGLSAITPLKYFVSDFASKKSQIKNILQKRKDRIYNYQKVSGSKYHPEKRLENPEKNITGIADLIIESNEGVVILDFKTGRIYTESIDECGNTEKLIKKQYELQLKLYAHLYFLMYGNFPSVLYLVTLTNDFIEIPFTKEECENIYSEAKTFLLNTNSIIEKSEYESLAKPSEENCKYCSSRPACSFYSDWIETNFHCVNDLSGILRKVTLFQNGSLGIQLEIDAKDVLINGLESLLKEGFENLIDKKIIIYNLKKTKQSLNATANNFTIVYEQ